MSNDEQNFNPYAYDYRHLGELVAKLEDKPNLGPPRTGGSQASIRLSDKDQFHLDALAEVTGWNRTELIWALLQAGFFLLYRQLDTADAEKVFKHLRLPMERDAFKEKVQ